MATELASVARRLERGPRQTLVRAYERIEASRRGYVWLSKLGPAYLFGLVALVKAWALSGSLARLLGGQADLQLGLLATYEGTSGAFFALIAALYLIRRRPMQRVRNLSQALVAVAGEPILYLQLRMFYKHKGTEKLKSDLKQKISRARDDLEGAKTGGKKVGVSHRVPHEGAGQVVLRLRPRPGGRVLGVLQPAVGIGDEVAVEVLDDVLPGGGRIGCRARNRLRRSGEGDEPAVAPLERDGGVEAGRQGPGGERLVERTRGQDPPGPQQEGVGEAGRDLLGVVGDENGRRGVEGGGEVGQPGDERLPAAEVEPGGRLVEEE